MTIAGIRLAFQAPEVIFGLRAQQSTMYSFLALVIIPLHPLIMSIREAILNKVLTGNRDKELELYRVKIRSQMRRFKRCELGIETVYQICGQTILAFFAITVTKTTEGLVRLFEYDPIDLEEKISVITDEKIPTVFQSTSFILSYLIISTIWSCFSCLKSNIESLSSKREYFPTTSKIMALLFLLCSLVRRVLCIVMYFSVPLGLFNLLRHIQSEQAQWDPVFENYFLDRNGYIKVGDTPKTLWASIDRWNGILQTPPHYRLYTVFSIKEYFFGFWIIMLLQCLAILLAKMKFSNAFKEMTIFEKICHVMENINIAQCTEDWDQRVGNAKEHIKRKDANLKEYLVLSLLNYSFNFFLLIPLSILGKHAYDLFTLISQNIFNAFRIKHLSPT